MFEVRDCLRRTASVYGDIYVTLYLGRQQFSRQTFGRTAWSREHRFISVFIQLQWLAISKFKNQIISYTLQFVLVRLVGFPLLKKVAMVLCKHGLSFAWRWWLDKDNVMHKINSRSAPKKRQQCDELWMCKLTFFYLMLLRNNLFLDILSVGCAQRNTWGTAHEDSLWCW